MNENVTIHEVAQRYDKFMESPALKAYYGHSDFVNFGYWTKETKTQKEASENLVETLLSFLPERQGTILDAACGLGAGARYLTRYYAPSNVFGINISDQQLAYCRKNAPGCHFALMDATRLEFDSEMFDTIICVEGGVHFNTFEQFLHQAWQALKPGGHLLVCDTLLSTPVTAPEWSWMIPANNYVQGIANYQAWYHRAGFEELSLIDAKEACWDRYCQQMRHWVLTKWLTKEMDEHSLHGLMRYTEYLPKLPVEHYVLVSAQKPKSA